MEEMAGGTGLMASPIGHSLSGMTLYLALRDKRWGPLSLKELAAATAFANMPDLDFLLGMMVGEPSRWHHQYSHSLFVTLFVSVCILVASMLVKDAGEYPGKMILSFGALLFLHIGLDFITADPQPPIGLQLFWPLSRSYCISPWVFIKNVQRGPLSLFLLKESVITAVQETLIFGSMLAGFLLWRKNGRRERLSQKQR